MELTSAFPFPWQNISGYTNAELVFLGIGNIHVMRDSLASLIKVAKANDPKSYLKDLDSTEWLSHIRAVLVTTTEIVKYIIDGRSVVIHCSDGWDRTAQTCSLAGFMLEPYYRTIRGFIGQPDSEDFCTFYLASIISVVSI